MYLRNNDISAKTKAATHSQTLFFQWLDHSNYTHFRFFPIKKSSIRSIRHSNLLINVSTTMLVHSARPHRTITRLSLQRDAQPGRAVTVAKAVTVSAIDNSSLRPLDKAAWNEVGRVVGTAEVPAAVRMVEKNVPVCSYTCVVERSLTNWKRLCLALCYWHYSRKVTYPSTCYRIAPNLDAVNSLHEFTRSVHLNDGNFSRISIDDVWRRFIFSLSSAFDVCGVQEHDGLTIEGRSSRCSALTVQEHLA